MVIFSHTCKERVAISRFNLFDISESSHGLNSCCVTTSVKNGSAFSIACLVPSKVYAIVSLSEVAVKLAPNCCKLRIMANFVAFLVDKPAAVRRTCVAPKSSGNSLRVPALIDKI